MFDKIMTHRRSHLSLLSEYYQIIVLKKWPTAVLREFGSYLLAVIDIYYDLGCHFLLGCLLILGCLVLPIY